MSQTNWQAKALGLKTELTYDHMQDDDPVIMLIQGKNVFGQVIFCYVKVPFRHYGDIKEKLSNNSQFDPRHYGEIIAAGQGTPSEEMKAEIAAEHGIIPVTISAPPPKADGSEGYPVEDVDNYPY